MTQPAGPTIPRISAEAAGVRFWTLLEESLQSTSQSGKPRLSTVNIPIAGATIPATVGWLCSFGVSFNARIVGYQIFSLMPGVVTLDLQRSTPEGHATDGIGSPLQFPSLIFDASLFPSMNGVYGENLDTSLWASRELLIGDMVQVYVVESSEALMCTMILYLQDLDERT